MPDLSSFLASSFSILPNMGRYAVYVWSSYAVTSLILGALFVMSVVSWRRTARHLKEREQHHTSSMAKCPAENETTSPTTTSTDVPYGTGRDATVAPPVKTPEHA